MPPGDPAPLLSLPGATFPPGRAVWYEGVGGLRLRAAYFPAAEPIGSVVINTGRTESIEKYVEVVGELVARGYTVLIHDWRGQGLSARLLADRLKGHAAGFDDFLADFGRLMDRFEADLPAPRLLLGHSMGGGLSLAILAAGEARFAGAILSAPMLGVATGRTPGWAARLTAWLMRRLGRESEYIPGGGYDPFTAPFEMASLTHDRLRYQRVMDQITTDRDLALGGVTWGWLSSAFRLIDGLARSPRIEALQLPVTLLAAGEEVLVLNGATRRIAGRLPRGRYVEIAGAYHELLLETDAVRARFWAEFDGLVTGLAA